MYKIIIFISGGYIQTYPLFHVNFAKNLASLESQRRSSKHTAGHKIFFYFVFQTNIFLTALFLKKITLFLMDIISIKKQV